MSRMTRIILRAVVPLALVGMTTPHGLSSAEAMKGIRALVFSGGSLREPVRVLDSESATALYLQMLGGRRAIESDSIPSVNGRRCVVVSAFIFNARNESLRLDELPPGQGDYNFRLYLFDPGERPVMTGGQQVWRLGPAITQDLAALGVPVADTTRSVGNCGSAPGAR